MEGIISLIIYVGKIIDFDKFIKIISFSAHDEHLASPLFSYMGTPVVKASSWVGIFKNKYSIARIEAEGEFW